MEDIRVASWNIRGLKGKWANVSQFLTTYDILFLSETLLPENDYHFPIKNYNIIKADRIDGRRVFGGGLSLYIRNDIQYQRFFILETPRFLEYIAIKIRINTEYLNLVFIYNPPNNEIDISTLSDWLEACSALPNLMITGDFNAQHGLWGSDMENTLGRLLSNSLEILRTLNNGCATRIYYKVSCPDLTLCSLELYNRIVWEVGQDSGGSDHFPILYSIKCLNGFNLNNRLKLGYSKIDWESFSESVELSLPDIDLFSPTNALEHYDDFINSIYKSVSSSGGKIFNDAKRPRKRPQNCVWWDGECSELVDSRRLALEEFRNSPSRESLSSYFGICKSVSRKLSKVHHF